MVCRMFAIHNPSENSRNDSDRELSRLKRQDLLELLLEQMREGERLQAEVNQLTSLSDRLKAKLDDKDVQIDHLKEKLNDKDVQIDHLKEKLDDKDAQIDRLKPKLDEKDAQIERLKHRLDDKDEQIDGLKAQARVLAHKKNLINMDELFETERQAVTAYIKSLADRIAEGESEEEVELVEPEAAEPEPAEPEADEEPVAEPEPEPVDETEATDE